MAMLRIHQEAGQPETLNPKPYKPRSRSCGEERASFEPSKEQPLLVRRAEGSGFRVYLWFRV